MAGGKSVDAVAEVAPRRRSWTGAVEADQGQSGRSRIDVVVVQLQAAGLNESTGRVELRDGRCLHLRSTIIVYRGTP